MEDLVKIAAFAGAAFTMGLGTIGPAIGQGIVGTQACKSIGEHPQDSNKIRTAMIIAMTLIETSAIYALIVSLLLIYKG